MPLVQVWHSDLSGKPIPDGQHVRVRIMYDDPERLDKRADLSIKEIEELMPFAYEVEPRGSRK